MSGNDANTLLLAHADETSGTTSIGNTAKSAPGGTSTLTGHGSAATDSAHAKFGACSMKFNALTGAYFTIPNAAALLLSGTDFTIDLWCYPTAAAGSGTYGNSFWDTSDSTVAITTLALNYNPSGHIILWGAASTSGWTFNNQDMGAAGFTLNAWNHVALIRSGNVFTVYVNGSSIGSVTNSVVLWTGETKAIQIGAQWQAPAGTSFPGWIDEVRVSNTARWTSNFTPPSLAYSVLATQTISVTCTSSVSLIKAVAKAIAVSSSSVTSISKQVRKAIAATCTSAVSVAASRAFLVVINAACSTAVSLNKSVGKIIAIACNGAVSIKKGITKALSVTSSTATTLTKRVAKTIPIAAQTATTILKRVGTSVVVSATSAVLLSRSIGKTVAVLCTSTTQIAKAVAITLSASSSASVSFVKAVAKTVGIGCVGAVSYTKAISKTLTVSCLTAVFTVIEAFVAGAGRLYRKMPWLPQPPYDVKPAKPFRPIWDIRHRQEAEAARKAAEPAPLPPPLPPISAFPLPPAAPPSLAQFAPQDPLGLVQRLTDAKEMTDMADAAQAAQDVTDAIQILADLDLIRKE